MALRVPTPNVSLVDLVVDVKQDVTVEMVNDAFKEAAKGDMAGIVRFTMSHLFRLILIRQKSRQLLMDFRQLLWGTKSKSISMV